MPLEREQLMRELELLRQRGIELQIEYETVLNRFLQIQQQLRIAREAASQAEGVPAI